MGIPAIGAALLLLGACTETQLAVHVAKKASQAAAPSAGEQRIRAEKVRRASLRPYTIRGVRYFPKDDPSYDETGLASWYGEPFHGRATATGEIFDMNRVSAAHKTLPLPATVEVTNLENGRVLTIRVNDRGPFVKGRIIDLSRRAAQLLGFEKQGVARVRVRLDSSAADAFVMRPAPITKTERKLVKAAPRSDVAVAALPPPTSTAGQAAVSQSTPVIARPDPAVVRATSPAQPVFSRPVPDTKLFVQAGSFSDFQNAQRLRARLVALGNVNVNHVVVNNRDFYRVRVGPIADVAAADRTLSRVVAAGSDDARIVVE
ncbi:septal ring lytic transglycosylase RlpA family protein [Minwuia sp.]|uniref:septal ring lytic transglycosylase RlpA family protein n=1 Tax=Minwuia sp. TaxID=2493630 RepID=UPI003A903EF4